MQLIRRAVLTLQVLMSHSNQLTNMKNLFKSLLIGGAALSMTACSDFLDQTSPSELTDKTVFNSTYYAKLALNKVYGSLSTDQTYAQYFAFVWHTNSDYELIDGFGDNANNTSSERGNMNYNQNPGWANIAKAWDGMYNVIEYANIVVDGINESDLIHDSATKDEAEQIKAEAQVLRAMVYLDLIRNFGDIPMKLNKSQADLSNVYLPKTDRDIILDSLISDLKSAAQHLPWADKVTTEHVNAGYAHALLANVALTRAGWAIRESSKPGYETAANSDATYPTQRPDEHTRKQLYETALEHLNTIIKKGVHQLNPSIEEYWYKVNQLTLDNTYRENLFEIPMGLGKTGELGYTVGVRINGSSTRYGVKGNSSGKVKVCAPYFWSFDHNDLRRDLTCAPYVLKETDGQLVEGFDGNKPFEIYLAKWDIRKMSEEWRQTAIAAGSAKWTTGINVTKIRYPYVLLMYAEVMNELYGADVKGECGLSARDALSLVHCRAFDEADKAKAAAYVAAIPGDKESFFNAIIDENAWELVGEGYRKYDLIRWNLLGERIEKMKNDYTNQLQEYPAKLYFKYLSDGCTIDMSSVQWYATQEEQDSMKDEGGWENKGFWGAELADDSKRTNIDTYLPQISKGLNATVKNRYLMPIASTTISASNGMLKNSYGFTN